MPKKQPQPKVKKKSPVPIRDPEPIIAPPPRSIPPPPAQAPRVELFLEDAKNEPKRNLIVDHRDTICVLRKEKRFTFRAIAEWLSERGIETDHSAVYRAYLSSIPEEDRDPRGDWSDVDVIE